MEVTIQIDKETQQYLLNLRKDAITLQQQIESTLTTYVRATGNSMELNYTAAEDFSKLVAQKEEEANEINK